MELLAKDVMKRDVITLPENTTIRVALKKMAETNFDFALLVETDGTLVGIVRDSHILGEIQDIMNIHSYPFENRIPCNQNVLAIEGDTPLRELWDLFLEYTDSPLPVVNSKKQVIGLISGRDIVRSIYEAMPCA